MLYADGGERGRILPERGGRAACPLCGEVVRAKCGEVVDWYWSHIAGTDCDRWFEAETPWHHWWKERARPDQREVTRGQHRADLITDRGLVVELQHSAISAEEIREREGFYGKMVWLLDGRTYDIETTLFDTAVTRLECLPSGKWYWRWPKDSFRDAQRPVYIDLGSLILRADLRLANPVGPMIFPGELRPRSFFLDRLGLSADKNTKEHVSYLARVVFGESPNNGATLRDAGVRVVRREFRRFDDLTRFLRRRRRRAASIVEAHAWCRDGDLDALQPHQSTDRPFEAP